MKPISEAQFKKLLQDRGYGGKALFKVVKAIPHWLDRDLPIGKRRSCVGVYLEEIKGFSDIFFQLTNNKGEVWKEDPHLYWINVSKLLYLIENKLANKISFQGRVKYEIPVEKCKVILNSDAISMMNSKVELKISVDQNINHGLIMDLKIEMERHRVAIDNIISKYEIK